MPVTFVFACMFEITDKQLEDEDHDMSSLAFRPWCPQYAEVMGKSAGALHTLGLMRIMYEVKHAPV